MNAYVWTPNSDLRPRHGYTSVPMSWPERVAMLTSANEHQRDVILTLDDALAAEVRENERLRALLERRSWRLRLFAAVRRVFG